MRMTDPCNVVVREVRSLRCALLCFCFASAAIVNADISQKVRFQAHLSLRVNSDFKRLKRKTDTSALTRYAEATAAPHICMYLDRSRTVALSLLPAPSCTHARAATPRASACLAAQALLAGGSCSRWRQMGLRGTPPPFTSITGRAVSPATRVVAHASERARAGPR